MICRNFFSKGPRLGAKMMTCASYEINGPQRMEATEFGVSKQFEKDTFAMTAFKLNSAKLGFDPA